MIKKLDSHTINLISAGEVIECPADILKELIENSIDANSKSIIITVKSSGLDLIEIKDDGNGIAKDDLPVALERHTTSKLSKIEDLYSIETFGFRGEALASIDAVSLLKIASSNNDSGAGYQYENGVLNEIPFNKGTTITIKDLFYNVPVRKKFLKSNSTEFTKLYNIFLEFVILNPEIKFQFISEKKNEIFSRTTQEGRYIQIFGKDTIYKTINIDTSNSIFKLKGLLCKPTNYFYFPINFLYINKRPVYSPQINKLITDSYKDYLMIQQKPFFIFFFELDSKILDVNVHPKKRIIRIQNEFIFLNQLKEEINAIFSKNIVQPQVSTKLSEFISNTKSPAEYGLSENEIKTVNGFKDNLYEETGYRDYNPIVPLIVPEELKFNNHKIKTVLGQILNTYIVCEIEDGMILIDQHAAEERINLEKNRLEFIDYVKVQNLMIPRKLDYMDSQTIDFIIAYKETLGELGFNIIRKEDQLYLTTIPEFLDHYFDQNFFYEILKDMEHNPNENLTKLKDRILKLKSCKESIKANDPLSISQIIKLIQKLDSCQDKTICAHGRPTSIVFNKKELEKIFKRIV